VSSASVSQGNTKVTMNAKIDEEYRIRGKRLADLLQLHHATTRRIDFAPMAHDGKKIRRYKTLFVFESLDTGVFLLVVLAA
jgi:hypothetical protein